MELNVTSNIREGVFLKNENGSVIRIKEVFHEMVIFDEEGTEHVLPKDMFTGYIAQENYKELKSGKPQNLKEVVESAKSVEGILESLCEASFKGIKIKSASSSDHAKGEVYLVYNKKTKKIVINPDKKNKPMDGLARNTAKEIAKLDPDFEVASSSWAHDQGIK